MRLLMAATALVLGADRRIAGIISERGSPI